MKAVKEFFNFVEGTTNEVISFEFALEGNPEEIDKIDYGGCSCTKGSYNLETNKITGTLDLGAVGVNNGVVFKTKYIKVLLDPDQPERIRASQLPTDHVLYDANSWKAVVNPNKRIVTLTIAGDVKYEKKVD